VDLWEFNLIFGVFEKPLGEDFINLFHQKRD